MNDHMLTATQCKMARAALRWELSDLAERAGVSANTIYSNICVEVGAGFVALRYPKRRNINTKTGKAVVTSRPEGLSGAPMVDTIELIKGNVSVVGVFTEQNNGQARGEGTSIIQAVLASF